MALMPFPRLLADVYEPCDCPKRKCRCGAEQAPTVGDEIKAEEITSFPRVFAVDPGTHTGWACLWFDPDVLFDQNLKVSKALVAWQAGMALGPEIRQVDFLLHRVRQFYGGEGLAVVVEDFVPRRLAMERTFLSPVRVGHMLAYGLHRGGREVDGEIRRRNVAMWSSANDAKNVCTDDRLKIWNTYLPGPDHPRDATRHAHLWMRRLKAGGDELYNQSHFVDEEE